MSLKIIFFLLSFSFTFFSNAQACIIIDSQPENQVVLDNNDIILTTEVSSSENLTFQWQVFNSNTNSWEAVQNSTDVFLYTGSNSNTLTISNVNPSIHNSQYRVLINGESLDCNEASNSIIIQYIDIRVNNIFTPNNDGFNDVFVINGITNSKFSNSKLQIYNRWGNLVYEKIGYQNDWDGIATSGITIGGAKKLPSGTYFYNLDLNYNNKKFSGWLYIVR